MRFRAVLLVIFLCVVLAGSLHLSRGETQTPVEAQACLVSANDAETVEENLAVLLKVLAMSSVEQSPLDDAEKAGIYYTMLASTRRYHEEMQERLPNCAEELNGALVETITATQDVVALKIAQSVNPEHRRYAARVSEAKAHLDAKWQVLAARSQETQLVPLGE